MSRIAFAVFSGIILSGGLIASSVQTDHGGTIICTSTGKLIVNIGRVEGIDPFAVRQGLIYLCDPNTMDPRGYDNPRWIWIKR